MKGYARAIGCATSVTTELWALRDGIRSAYLLEFQRLCLNAKLVIDLLKKDVENSNGVGVLVVDCREWAKEDSFDAYSTLLQKGEQVCRCACTQGSLSNTEFYHFHETPI